MSQWSPCVDLRGQIRSAHTSSRTSRWLFDACQPTCAALDNLFLWEYSRRHSLCETDKEECNDNVIEKVATFLVNVSAAFDSHCIDITS